MSHVAVRGHDEGYLVERLARVFARRSVVSKWGIQYRLCETGPTRLDPRLVAASLRRLAGGNRHPFSPVKGALSDPVLPSAESHRLAEIAIAALQAADIAGGSVTATELAVTLKLTGASSRATTATTSNRRIIDQINLPVFSAVIDLRKSPISVWLSHDLAWIYPDDPTLWRLVLKMAKSNRRLLIVARKIAPATFHLLKLFGARGVQYYSVLHRTASAESAQAFDNVGLPHLITLTGLAKHPVRKRIRSCLSELPSISVAAEAEMALALADSRGFATSSPPTPATLLDWTNQQTTTWPPIWSEMLEAWREAGSKPLTVGPPLIEPLDNHDSAATHLVAEFDDDFESLSDQILHEPKTALTESTVARSRVAAEVDRETWDRLRARAISHRKG